MLRTAALAARGCARASAIAMAIVLASALSACSSGPTTILESDVPLVAGTEVRQSTGLTLSGSELQGGRAICFGRMESVAKAVEATDVRYANHGWTILRRTESRDRVETTYFKHGRHADVLIEFNSIDPQMSRATIAVKRVDATEPPPARMPVR
ncbi:MAG: hypothetical protein O2855_03805 [Planctomycetota bacterium]|nr:hypothetical protein [Planctomycetota bacterium]